MQASARELLVAFFTSLVWCGGDSNPRPPAPKVDTLPTELSRRSIFDISVNTDQIGMGFKADTPSKRKQYVHL